MEPFLTAQVGAAGGWPFCNLFDVVRQICFFFFFFFFGCVFRLIGELFGVVCLVVWRYASVTARQRKWATLSALMCCRPSRV